jgi:hypothetical protein
VLITHAIVRASLFAHARSDGADIVVTAGDETTKLKRELVTYEPMAGGLELYVRIPSLSSVTDSEVYIYYGNAGAAKTNDADTWNADYGVVYHLKEAPAGTAPQAKAPPMRCTALPGHRPGQYALGWQLHPLRQRPAPARRRQPCHRGRRSDHDRGFGQRPELAYPGRGLPQGRQLHPLQLQRRLLLVSLRAGQPAAARHRRHARERQLGLHRRHL